MKIFTTSAAIAIAITACGGSQPPTTQPAPAPVAPAAPEPVAVTQAPPAVPAQHGVLLGDLDRSIDPCTDFYEFANGAWRKANPIPPTQKKWSRRWEAGETNKERLKQLLEDTAAQQGAPHGSAAQIVGDFYGACMDEPRADAAGVTPIAPLLAEIDAIKSPTDVQHVVTHLHAIGLDAGFGIHSVQDPHDPEHVIASINPGGVGLPDRDYYVKPDARFADARKVYRAHIGKMFALAGRHESAATLDAVFALETTFGKAMLDNVASRNPDNLVHPTPFDQLGKLHPHVAWAAELDALHVAHDTLNRTQPAFLTAYDRALTATPVATWKAYLVWSVLRQSGAYLSKPLVDEVFAFDNGYLEGAKEAKPRWKRCAELADGLFGEALGQKYVERYFSPAAKARVKGMVDNILAATGDSIRAASWMSDETKQRALAKLATFNPKIGYPDKWKDYRGVTVTRDALWDDIVAGGAYAVTDDLGQIGKPVDRARWGMTPPTSDAYYNPQLNEIVFPAGILQPPMFDMDANDAVNYGGIGVVIGHEVSHGFDDQGAKFDAKGALTNWWTPEDKKQFDARGACVADQFDHYFIEPGIHHNGKHVLGEAIGDLGGLTIAYRAFHKSLAGGTAPTVDGFTPDQQFFISWGQSRGDATRPELARTMMQNDPHPVAKFRVIGPMANTQAFADAFSCKADAPMMRPAASRCTVW